MVDGQTVLAVVDGIGAFAKTGSGILARHGIEAPVPMRWYSRQACWTLFGRAGSAPPEFEADAAPALILGARWPI
jgi:hypothetical protein